MFGNNSDIEIIYRPCELLELTNVQKTAPV
jgi:hypothetical protein